MPLQPNKVVSLNFTLKDNEGNVIEKTSNEQPFTFLSGNQQILPKLEENVESMIIGGKKNIVLSPEEAYGEYQESAVQSVKKTEFPEDTELAEGMSFVAGTPDGKQMPFTVKNIEGEDVTIDFNHPLAGKTLEFDIELLDIRDATPEEVSHGHVHGQNGHQH